MALQSISIQVKSFLSERTFIPSRPNTPLTRKRIRSQLPSTSGVSNRKQQATANPARNVRKV